jgi:2-keto-4-pentenoate hydratase
MLTVGQERLRGASVNPGGDPMRLLLWLANEGSRQFGGLRKGQVVITGSCLPLVHANPGDVVRAAISGLGELEFRFD